MISELRDTHVIGLGLMQPIGCDESGNFCDAKMTLGSVDWRRNGDVARCMELN